MARQYSQATVDIYLLRISKFLKAWPDPAAATQDNIQDYLLSLQPGLSRISLEGHYSALKNFYSYLKIKGKATLAFERNPLADLLPIKREKKVPRIIPNDDLSAILRAPDLKTLRGCRDYCIMLFLLHGLRAAEICALDMDRVFPDGWGPSRHVFIDIKGKGRKERRIIMERSGDTEWAWNRYMKMRNGDGSEVAFPAIHGKGKYKRMSPNGLYRMLDRYSKRLSISNIHPHVWRHTTAVKMLEDGVELKEIQYRLGHESVQTTEKYLGAAAILQEKSSGSRWIQKLKKADARFRRWRK